MINLEDIQIGDYVRMDDSPRLICLGIGKLKNKSEGTAYVYFNQRDILVSASAEDFSKTGKKLIDVVDSGDFVNYSRVVAHLGDHLILENGSEIESAMIESVLTRQQYNALKHLGKMKNKI